MQANAEEQQVFASTQCALDGNCSGYGFYHGWEFGDKPVTCGIGDAATAQSDAVFKNYA